MESEGEGMSSKGNSTMELTERRNDLGNESSFDPSTPTKPGGWQKYLGVVYTLISTNMFALASNILKLMTNVHPLTVGLYAFPVGALLTTPFIWYTLKVEKESVTTNMFPIRENKKTVFLVWVRSTLQFGITVCLTATIKYISVADMRTILAASVITVSLCGWLCLGEKCGVVLPIVAVMALCGIGIMTRPPILTGSEAFDEDTLIGVSLAIVCMLLATAILILLRFLQNVHLGVQNVMYFCWAFIINLPLALFTGTAQVPENPWFVVGLLGVGVLWTFGNSFLVMGIQREEASVVALIRTSEVIFTFIWQMIILNVIPDLISLIGAVLVLTGVIVVTLRKWVASLDAENPTRKRLKFLLL